MSGFLCGLAVIAVHSQTPPLQNSAASSAEVHSTDLLQMKKGQQLLWKQWTADQTVVVLWQATKAYNPADLKGKYPEGMDVAPPDWWNVYNMEVRRVGKTPKIVWQRQMAVYKSSSREGVSPFQIVDVAMDSKSLVFTFIQDAGIPIFIAQHCALNGPISLSDDLKIVTKREPTSLRHIKTDYGRTLWFSDGWPLNSHPVAQIEKETSPVEGEWVLGVSDSKGNKSRWHFNGVAWKVVQPYTPAPTPPALTRAQKAAQDSLKAREKNMGIYKSLRTVGQSKEKATQSVRSMTGDKTWEPLPAVWDTPEFKVEPYWLTPTPPPTPAPTPTASPAAKQKP